MSEHEIERRKGNTILALALIKYLYNKGHISKVIYDNIKNEYSRIENQ